MVRLVWRPFRVHHQAMQPDRAALHRSVGILGALLLLFTIGSSGATAQNTVKLVPFVSGLDAPVFVTNAGDGSGRLFVVQQGGKIMVVKNGAVLPTPFLDISDLVSTGGEQGLLGLAFHPELQDQRLLLRRLHAAERRHRHPRYKVSSTNPDVADRATRDKDPDRRPAVREPQRRDARVREGRLPLHRDGRRRLAAATRETERRASASLLGKILRIDVNGSVGTRHYLIPPTNPYVGTGGTRRDLVARPAQPVALLVRSADRRPVDR